MRCCRQKRLWQYLKDNGSTDCTLSDIRLRYYAAYGNELCWRYPISDGIHAGAFILVTKDGYLSLPYNSMDEDEYEILMLDDAVPFMIRHRLLRSCQTGKISLPT